jgi:hypothetical protein
MLPRIHAVEFLDEPQYGGGRPVPSQQVFEAFAPYGPTRLPTSVTHSEETIWRYYAGLSDYPHFDAFEYRRELKETKPSWDLASVTGPNGGPYFALDLAYVPDLDEKAFKFQPREGTFVFRLPAYLAEPKEVFRIDADGVHEVRHQLRADHLEVSDRIGVAGVYVASTRASAMARMKARHAELMRFENELDFDPVGRESDSASLKQLLP